MDQKVIDAWKSISEQLEQAWPYKRVRASTDLIQKYNDTVGKQTGYEFVEFVVTVAKDVAVDDDIIWEAMTMKIDAEPVVFGDSNKYGNPPHTGRIKRSLLEGTDDDSLDSPYRP